MMEVVTAQCECRTWPVLRYGSLDQCGYCRTIPVRLLGGWAFG